MAILCYSGNRCLVVGIVILYTLPIGWLYTDILATKEILARIHPNYLDLMIALAGGAVNAVKLRFAKLSRGGRCLRLTTSFAGMARSTFLT